MGLVDDEELVGKEAQKDRLFHVLLGLRRQRARRRLSHLLRDPIVELEIAHNVVPLFNPLVDFLLDFVTIRVIRHSRETQIGHPGTLGGRPPFPREEPLLLGRLDEFARIENRGPKAVRNRLGGEDEDGFVGHRVQVEFGDVHGRTRLADADAVVQQDTAVGRARMEEPRNEVLNGRQAKLPPHVDAGRPLGLATLKRQKLGLSHQFGRKVLVLHGRIEAPRRFPRGGPRPRSFVAFPQGPCDVVAVYVSRFAVDGGLPRSLEASR